MPERQKRVFDSISEEPSRKRRKTEKKSAKKAAKKAPPKQGKGKLQRVADSEDSDDSSSTAQPPPKRRKTEQKPAKAAVKKSTKKSAKKPTKKAAKKAARKVPPKRTVHHDDYSILDGDLGYLYNDRFWSDESDESEGCGCDECTRQTTLFRYLGDESSNDSSTWSASRKTALYIPLVAAAYEGNLKKVKSLIRGGASLEASSPLDSRRARALHVAASLGHTSVVKYLLKKGAECGHRVGTLSELNAAILSGSLSCVKTLLRGGAVDMPQGSEEGAVFTAVRGGVIQILEYLLGQGLTLNFVNQVSLTESVATFDGRIPTMLIDAGALGGGAAENEVVHYASAMEECLAPLLRAGVDPTAFVLDGSATTEGNGAAPIHIAAKAGLKPLRKLLQQGVPLDVFNHENLTPLMIAAIEDNVDCFVLLLEAGADMEVANTEGDKAIIFAIANSPRCLKELLKRGAEVDTRRHLLHAVECVKPAARGSVAPLIEYGAPIDYAGEDGQTALHKALLTGNTPVAKYLLMSGASVSVADVNGNNALHHAVTRSFTSVVLEFDPPLDAVNNEGENALARAINAESDSSVRELVKAGVRTDWRCRQGYTPFQQTLVLGMASAEAFLKADLSRTLAHTADAEGRFPMMFAACGGHSHIGEMLLNHGADVNCVDRIGRTPLMFAAMLPGRWEFIYFLLDNAAQVLCRSHENKTALHYGVDSGDVDQCLLMLHPNLLFCAARLSLLEMKDNSGTTPLARAAMLWETPIMCATLICQGARTDTKNNDGETPLHTACIHGHIQIVRLLAEDGEGVCEVDEEGRTALLLAAFGGHTEMVRYLLNRPNIQKNHQDNKGSTALHLAAQNECADVIEILLKHGADKHLRDKEFNAPMDYAIEGQCPECRALLR